MTQTQSLKPTTPWVAQIRAIMSKDGKPFGQAELIDILARDNGAVTKEAIQTIRSNVTSALYGKRAKPIFQKAGDGKFVLADAVLEHTKANQGVEHPTTPEPSKLPHYSRSRRDGNSRVFWSEKEKDLIAEGLLEARKHDPMPSMLQLFDKAQCVLPPDRQRPTVSPKSVKEILDKVKLKIALKKKEEEFDDVPPVILEVQVPQPIDAQKILNETPTPYLCGTLIDRFLHGIDRLESALRKEEKPSHKPRSHHHNNHHTTLAPVEKKKPCVAIVGLLPDQAQHVAEKAKSIPLDLHFIDKERSETSYPARTDYVIVQRHSRHRWYEKARDQFQSNRVFFIDGGISLVVQKLYDISSQLNHARHH
jgi:hypothetical protein